MMKVTKIDTSHENWLIIGNNTEERVIRREAITELYLMDNNLYIYVNGKAYEEMQIDNRIGYIAIKKWLLAWEWNPEEEEDGKYD